MDKSSAFAILAVKDKWFSDDLPLNLDGKKTIEQTSGKWIIEAAELSGMRRADVEHLKAFLSRQVDIGRLAYGRIVSNVPRQFIVLGTTNSDRYLKDLTGNRRFWPVKVGKIDIESLKNDRDQLWAEAVAYEKQGASIRLDPSLYGAAEIEQTERTAEDPWLDPCRYILKELNGIIINTDVWNMVGVDIERRTQDQNVRIGNVMKALGFERTTATRGGKTHNVYARGSKEERKLRISITVNRNEHGRKLNVVADVERPRPTMPADGSFPDPEESRARPVIPPRDEDGPISTLQGDDEI
jgi:predicted P-loop ATPase